MRRPQVTAAADKSALGEFLRSRRQALQPEDLGLYRGPRRRADGLRPEEVAELTGLSVDYIGRLERGGGPWPSNGVLLAIALAWQHVREASKGIGVDLRGLNDGHAPPRGLARFILLLDVRGGGLG
jgi:transcriptional regulator with XRE-family HTH domain